ncbi:MAG TPA: prefoldin subunit alpha [Thermoplasmatales archaeon]|nr:prefoldin subunit alpha [Thermoplasmata archaeon]RLF62342.1 MAG: prefoldin subunit alpha [Thermoplasmata archaeon]HDM25483.1 prefoldin subunit alpha [Thermoplasmatales archaeon]
MSNEKDKEAEVSRYLSLLEMYKEQIESLVNQSQIIQAMIDEYNRTKLTLDKISNVEEKTEVLVSIGGGVFVNANIRDTKKVVYNIGADIMIEKTIEETVKSIDERINLLYENLQKVVETTQKLEEAAAQISEKVQEMVKK